MVWAAVGSWLMVAVVAAGGITFMKSSVVGSAVVGSAVVDAPWLVMVASSDGVGASKQAAAVLSRTCRQQQQQQQGDDQILLSQLR
jgi:hypothetical protein